MDEEKKRALLQKWQKWRDEQPDEIIIGDVILKKRCVNGVLVYSAPVDVRFGRT